MHGLERNARFRGVLLQDLLRNGRMGSRDKEIVFYGADEAEERLRRTRCPARFTRSLLIVDPLDDDGRHRLLTRARDAAGVQPTEAEASRTKATPWENDGQVVREVTVPP